MADHYMSLEGSYAVPVTKAMKQNRDQWKANKYCLETILTEVFRDTSDSGSLSASGAIPSRHHRIFQTITAFAVGLSVIVKGTGTPDPDCLAFSRTIFNVPFWSNEALKEPASGPYPGKFDIRL